MGKEEAKKAEALDEVAPAPPPRPEDKPDDLEILAVVEGSRPPEESSAGSVDRDAVLERVATEKRMSLIKTWEESERPELRIKLRRCQLLLPGRTQKRQQWKLS